ncbi:hypothetical protein OSB04_007777 [Centaurea solstitialis]|uniref:Uncharacterized protein n=1 Tax=Centaurea solstitialis TaxID=347529 RepID=A0AA38U3Q8_9ASTR|nr:hypothetical protein OSB04_007777 [Centaurea solstitialis]
MADFGAPSFSLGLDCDDSDRQIDFPSQNTDSNSSNHSSIASATVTDDDFETLIVDDSEPEDPDPHPKRHRRRLLTVPAPELHSTAGDDRQDVCKRNGLSKEQKVVESIDVSTTENPWEDYRSMKHETHDVQANQSSQVTRISFDLEDSFPPAHRYFFHNDSRIQELVRNRLPNFSPLSNGDRDQHPCTSTINYKGQFSHGESSNRKNKDSSSSRKTSKRSKIEEESQGWVNPKLSVDKRLTKGTRKRKVYAGRQTAGRWLTDLDGKKPSFIYHFKFLPRFDHHFEVLVYVSKMGEELSGQVAYRRYRKESGAGSKKAKKRKSAKS